MKTDSVSPSFSGFSDQALEFLTHLPRRETGWFKAHHSTYEAEVAEPAKAFVVVLGDALRPTYGSGLEAVPKTNGSIAPINNDRRFSPRADPYKDHLLFRFWEGSPKKHAPTVMVRVHPDGIGFAAGVNLDKVGVRRWREAVDSDEGAVLAGALDLLERKQKAEVVGATRKTVPAPYAPDHPRADLLRHGGLQVRWQEPVPAGIGSVRFVSWCATRLGRVQPVHAWLTEYVGP